MEEFKVQTNYFSAEFGNTGGTIINMVSKSGTNELHGVGYYFRRDAAMNANNWFSNSRAARWRIRTELVRRHDRRPGLPSRDLQRKEPDILLRATSTASPDLSATTSTASVPTALQLAGDFSDTRLANGNLVPIYDPSSTSVDASGNTLRNPIPGNIIPPSRQNPIARPSTSTIPLPTPGRPLHARQQLVCPGQHTQRSNKIDAKIDHNISDKQRLSSRYSVNWGWSGVANLTGNISHNGNPGISRSQNFIMDYTRTQSPTTVFTARAGVLRAKSVRDPLSIGFDAVKNSGSARCFRRRACKRSRTTAPELSRDGRRRVCDHPPLRGRLPILGLDDQDLRAATPLRPAPSTANITRTTSSRILPNGSLTFSRNQTAQNPLVSSSTQGDGLASALLGFGSGGVMSIDYPTAQTAGYFGTYINDDWRISRRLTLNLGLRYDFDIPRTDRYNRINWLDLGAPSPLADNPQLKALFPGRLNGLMRFADADHRSPYEGDYNNWQPRVGLAYALNSKTSIRAAWGLFYVVSRHTVKGEVGTAFGFTDTSIPWTLDSGRTQYATLSNPFPVGLTFLRAATLFRSWDAARERPCRETTIRSTSNGPSPSNGKCRATVWWRRTTSAPRARTCSLARGTWCRNWIRWPRRTGAWGGTRSRRWCRIRSTGSLRIPRRPRITSRRSN